MFWAIMVLPRPLLPTRIRLRASRQEVQRQCPFDHIAFDLGGPGPVEVGHGLELLDLADAQPPFQTAVGAFGGLGLRQMFQDLARGPALFGGARQKVVQLRGQGASRSAPVEPDRLLLGVVVVVSIGRVHRKSPDHAGGHPAIGLEDGG